MIEVGSAVHRLCPKYCGPLPKAPAAIKIWETFTFFLKKKKKKGNVILNVVWLFQNKTNWVTPYMPRQAYIVELILNQF